MKNTCIIFAGGLYGTFVEWCINYFTDKNFPSRLPFTSNGSSHFYRGNLYLDMKEMRQYIDSDLDKPTVRVHLVTDQQSDDTTISDLKYLYNNFKKLIFLYTEENTCIWGLNNKFDKIYKVFYGYKPDEDRFFDTGNLDIGKQINEPIVERLKFWNTDLENAEMWQIRECLSSGLVQGYLLESSTHLIDTFKNQFPNIIFIPIRDLRDSFEQTFTLLIDKLGLELVRDDFENIYQKWITLQSHRYKDDLIKTIVDYIINGVPYDWSKENLTLVDEASIQNYLRTQGIEIKCWNLNIFPTNTNELRKYFDNVA